MKQLIDYIPMKHRKYIVDCYKSKQCCRYTRNIGGDIAKVYGWNVSTGKKKEV